MLGLAETAEGTEGCGRIIFAKIMQIGAYMSVLLVAIFCFGRGRRVKGFVEIKILDQNLTLLKMI